MSDSERILGTREESISAVAKARKYTSVVVKCAHGDVKWH